MYDYLEIGETDSSGRIKAALNDSLDETRRYCGDWSAKLKLLRRVVTSSRLELRFHSDHSRGFPGFHANVRLENPIDFFSPNLCNNRKLDYFDQFCYLFITYPQVLPTE